MEFEDRLVEEVIGMPSDARLPHLQFAEGNYTYTVDNFEAGDIFRHYQTLHSPTVVNSSYDDGSVDSLANA